MMDEVDRCIDYQRLRWWCRGVSLVQPDLPESASLATRDYGGVKCYYFVGYNPPNLLLLLCMISRIGPNISNGPSSWQN